MSAFLLLSGLAQSAALDNLPSVTGPGEGQPILHAQPAGDLDGDGLGDIVFTSPYDDNDAGHEAGAIYVVYGHSYDQIGERTPILDLVDSGAAVRLTGETTQDYAGYSIAALGDADGDGLDDFAIGAPEATPAGGQPIAGKVYVLYGNPGGLGLSGSIGDLGDHPWFYGSERHVRAGMRIFAPGDVDGDGMAEILIGAPYPTANGEPGIGWLAMYYGTADGWGQGGPFRIDLLYDPVAPATNADAAFLVTASNTFVGRAAAVVPGEAPGEWSLIMGAPGYTDAGPVAPPPQGGGAHGHDLPSGAVYVFDGPARDALEAQPFVIQSEAEGVIRGEIGGDYLPWEIVALSDGRVLLAAPEAGETIGAAYLFDRMDGDLVIDDAQAIWTGAGQGALLGWGAAAWETGGALAALGEPGWEAGAGRVLLVGEAEGEAGEVAVHELIGCWPDGLAGTSVRTHPGPDPYGDMSPWMGITAPAASVHAIGDGIAYVLTADDLAGLGDDCDIPEGTIVVDADQDGWGADEDCDDGAAWRYPGAPEVCGDGVDDDCDGEADEDCGPAPEDEGGCGCAPAGGGGGGWIALLAAAGMVGRRRSGTGSPAATAIIPPARATRGGRSEKRRAIQVSTTSRLRHAGLFALLIAPAAHAQDDARPLARIWGSAAEEYLQGPVVSGDFDGDGAPDLAVANYRGAAFFYAAGEVHLLTNPLAVGDVPLAEVRTVIFGAAEHDYVGSGVAVLLGDDAGDPDDLLVGASHAGLTSTDSGEAFFYPDPLAGSSTLHADAAYLLLQGEDEADRFGETVRFADLDGDGVQDAVVSAPTHDPAGAERNSWYGRVWVLHGPIDDWSDTQRMEVISTAHVPGAAPRTWAGWRVEAPGDVDGDGRDDLLIGSLGEGTNPDFTGRLHHYSGLDVGDLKNTNEAEGTWTVNTPGAYLGFGLSAGDVDADGRAEVAISSYTMEGGSGKVWLMDNAPVGDQDIDQFARGVFTGERGTGTGYALAVGPALLVGAPYADQVLALDADMDVIGVAEGGGFLGNTVSWVDDMNFDGIPEAVIVAPEATRDLHAQGVALVLSGEDVLDGDLAGAVVGVPDADGDGADADEDCDDADPRRFPENDEICRDDLDNDCDGATDEEDCFSSCGVVAGGGWWGTLLAVVGLWRRRSGGALFGGWRSGSPIDPPSLRDCSRGGRGRGGVFAPRQPPTSSVALVQPPSQVGAVRGAHGGSFAPAPRDPGRTRAPLLAALLLTLAGALGCAPDLTLDVPGGALAGEVPVSLTGNYDQLMIMVDGQAIAGGEGPTFSATWDTTTLDDGPHVLRGVGFRGKKEPVEVSLDVQTDQSQGTEGDLAVTFLRPGDGQEVSSTVEIRLLIEGVGAALDEVVLIADDAILASLPAAGPYEVSWENVDQGAHTLRAEVFDVAGRYASEEIAITVDNAADVTCNITSPDDGGDASQPIHDITVAIEAPGLQITSVDFFADGALLGSDASSPWAYPWETAGYAVGEQVEVGVEVFISGGGGCTDNVIATISDGSGSGDFEVLITQPTESSDPPAADSTSYPVKAAIGGGAGPEYAWFEVEGVQVGETLYPPQSEWSWGFDATSYDVGDEVELSVLAYEIGTTGDTAVPPASDTVFVTIAEPGSGGPP